MHNSNGYSGDELKISPGYDSVNFDFTEEDNGDYVVLFPKGGSTTLQSSS